MGFLAILMFFPLIIEAFAAIFMVLFSPLLLLLGFIDSTHKKDSNTSNIVVGIIVLFFILVMIGQANKKSSYGTNTSTSGYNYEANYHLKTSKSTHYNNDTCNRFPNLVGCQKEHKPMPQLRDYKDASEWSKEYMSWLKQKNTSANNIQTNYNPIRIRNNTYTGTSLNSTPKLINSTNDYKNYLHNMPKIENYESSSKWYKDYKKWRNSQKHTY